MTNRTEQSDDLARDIAAFDDRYPITWEGPDVYRSALAGWLLDAGWERFSAPAEKSLILTQPHSDPELNAMHAVLKVLDVLDLESRARERVAQWLQERTEDDARVRPQL